MYSLQKNQCSGQTTTDQHTSREQTDRERIPMLVANWCARFCTPKQLSFRSDGRKFHDHATEIQRTMTSRYKHHH